jgi:penicillin-binding protein 2
MKKSTALQNTLEPWRIGAFLVVLLVIFGIYIARLFVLQVIEYPEWLAQSLENRKQNINIAAPRGIIYDRNGFVLARNVPSYNIVVTPANLPDDPGEIQAVYRELSLITGVPVNLNEITTENPFVPCQSEHGIAQIVTYGETTAPFEPVRIACDVSSDVAMIVQENQKKWLGAGVEVQPIRDYPTGGLTASIIGFLGPIPASEEIR